MKWNVDTYQLVVDNKNEVMYAILRDYSLTHSLIPVEALMTKLFKTSFIYS